MTPAVFVLVAGFITSAGQVLTKATAAPTYDACKTLREVHMNEAGPPAIDGEPYRATPFAMCVPVQPAGKDA